MCVCRKTMYTKDFIFQWVAWPCLKIFLESKSSNFCWSKVAKFWLGDESFPRRKAFLNEVFRDKIIVFLKSFVTPSKIRTVINFYPKTSTSFPKNYFHGQITFSRILKIIETWMLKLSWQVNIHSCKCIVTRWFFSRIDTWGLSDSSSNRKNNYPKK